jgi:KipI family sensor histidine kinase inhibitor
MRREEDSVAAPRVSLLGTTAILFEAPGELSLEQQKRIWALAEQAHAWNHVREAVAGMNNLMVVFSSPPPSIQALESLLQEAWDSGARIDKPGRLFELPVSYGGEFGPHLHDVVDHTGLSAAEVIRLHCEPEYIVYALGSHPGYCYLGGMNERIATPRRKVPIVRLPGGSVSIGGVQTGVSASDGPSGWNTIGRTSMTFFDAGQSPPALLAPGDRIRFTVERIES